VNGNVKLEQAAAAARSGEWAQHFSNASCCTFILHAFFFVFLVNSHYMNVQKCKLQISIPFNAKLDVIYIY